MSPKIKDLLETQRLNPETARAGLKWEEYEDKMLLEQIKKDMTFEEISKNLFRSEKSVKTRLIVYAINKMEKENENVEKLSKELKISVDDIYEYQSKKATIEEKRKMRTKNPKKNDVSSYDKQVSIQDIYKLLLDMNNNISILLNR